MQASKQASMQVSGGNQVWLLMLRSGYMLVAVKVSSSIAKHSSSSGNNANLNESKSQFQLKLSLAQFSLSYLINLRRILQAVFGVAFFRPEVLGGNNPCSNISYV